MNHLEKINEITYEKESLVLIVLETYRGFNPQRLSFKNILHPDDFYFAKDTLEKTTRLFYQHIRPLFKNVRKYHYFIEESLKSTFFEENDFFEKKHGPEKNGLYYSTEHRKEKPGCHIKVTSSSANVLSTVIHEWAHRLHDFSCIYEFTPYTLNQYDDIMIEILAINLERINCFYDYKNDPHLTAWRTLEWLEKEEEFAKMTLAQRWICLLKYRNFSELEKDLSSEEFQSGSLFR